MTSTHTDAGGWFDAERCTVEDLARAVDRHTVLADYPYADAVEQGVLVYGARLRTRPPPGGPARRAGRAGPGAARRPRHRGVQRRVPGPAVVDRATAAFDALIAEQQAARRRRRGDHFAKPGANDRVWGALDKLALRDPETFADYYANDVLALVAQAWLGPGYQVTSQVNVVNPGGAGADRAPRLPPRVHVRDAGRAVPGARAPAVPGADPAGRGRARRHAGRDRPDAVPAALAEVRARLPRLPPARSSRRTSTSTTSSCRWRKGDAVVLQPGAVPRRRAPTGPPTSGGWRTCCRCRRRSAGRWRRVDRAAMCRRIYPVLPARSAGAAPRELARNIVAACGRGLPVPDQPRPRPAGGRPGAAGEPGGPPPAAP